MVSNFTKQSALFLNELFLEFVKQHTKTPCMKRHERFFPTFIFLLHAFVGRSQSRDAIDDVISGICVQRNYRGSNAVPTMPTIVRSWTLSRQSQAVGFLKV